VIVEKQTKSERKAYKFQPTKNIQTLKRKIFVPEQNDFRTVTPSGCSS